MRLNFGEQTPYDYAKYMWDQKDPEWCSSFIWYRKIGTPPKDYGSYNYLTLIGMLVDMENIIEEESKKESSTTFDQSYRIGPPTLGPAEWDKAYKTGDPEVDRWEQELAAGLIPDLG